MGASGDADVSTALQQIKRDEDFCATAYRDSRDLLTIGFGRLIDARKNGGISLDEAEQLLRNDVAREEAALDGALDWWRSLNAPRRAVLVNMCFNLGLEGLLTFHKALDAMEAKRWHRAAREMLDSRWHGQVGARAERLARQMETGLWVD